MQCVMIEFLENWWAKESIEAYAIPANIEAGEIITIMRTLS